MQPRRSTDNFRKRLVVYITGKSLQSCSKHLCYVVMLPKGDSKDDIVFFKFHFKMHYYLHFIFQYCNCPFECWCFLIKTGKGIL